MPDCIDSGYMKNLEYKLDKKLLLLEAREILYNNIQSLSENSDGLLIVLSVNTPGERKNSVLTGILLKNGLDFLIKLLQKISKNQKAADFDFSVYEHIFQITKIKYLNSLAGDSIVFFMEKLTSDRKIFGLKKEIKEFENKMVIFDYDFYFRGKKINFQDLGLKPKKCLVCGKNYFNCRACQQHSFDQIKKAFELKSREFIEPVFSDLNLSL